MPPKTNNFELQILHYVTPIFKLIELGYVQAMPCLIYDQLPTEMAPLKH